MLARDQLAELLQALEEWRPAHIEKWLDRKTHGASGRISPLRIRQEIQAVLRRGDGELVD